MSLKLCWVRAKKHSLPQGCNQVLNLFQYFFVNGKYCHIKYICFCLHCAVSQSLGRTFGDPSDPVDLRLPPGAIGIRCNLTCL